MPNMQMPNMQMPNMQMPNMQMPNMQMPNMGQKPRGMPTTHEVRAATICVQKFGDGYDFAASESNCCAPRPLEDCWMMPFLASKQTCHSLSAHDYLTILHASPALSASDRTDAHTYMFET